MTVTMVSAPEGSVVCGQKDTGHTVGSSELGGCPKEGQAGSTWHLTHEF